MSDISVVICTHNPRRESLQRTMDALRNQDLPASRWELIVIDNASSPALAGGNVDWHPQGCIVVEPRLGVSHARARGLAEASSELIVFVDDDNLLAPDYLSTGLRKAGDWPMIGCWGGQLLPEFESTPPPWLRHFWQYLAIFPLERDMWCNLSSVPDAVPPTAGMFVRRKVASRYLEVASQNPVRQALGIFGNRRVGGEDVDLALTSCDMGMGIARFKDLTLTHLIPDSRCTEDYVAGLLEGIRFSDVLLGYLRSGRMPAQRQSRLDEWLRKWRIWRLPPREKRFATAELAGHQAGLHYLFEQTKSLAPMASRDTDQNLCDKS